MSPPLTAAHLDALRRYDTCTVAGAIDVFQSRLRNEGYTDSTIRCLTPRSSPLVGYAVTVKIRCSNPQPEGRSYLDRPDWLTYLSSIPEPRIVVIQDADEHPGTGAFPGEIRANIWRALGCAGAITNGAIHDLPALQKMDFHVFAAGLAVSHAYAHIVEFGRMVEVGGLRVSSGDLLHADVHGVLSIPVALAADIPSVAEAIIERERRILELCSSESFSLEKLHDVMKTPVHGPSSAR